jgi:hypothetical protein
MHFRVKSHSVPLSWKNLELHCIFFILKHFTCSRYLSQLELKMEDFAIHSEMSLHAPQYSVNSQPMKQESLGSSSKALHSCYVESSHQQSDGRLHPVKEMMQKNAATKNHIYLLQLSIPFFHIKDPRFKRDAKMLINHAFTIVK